MIFYLPKSNIRMSLSTDSLGLYKQNEKIRWTHKQLKTSNMHIWQILQQLTTLPQNK